MKKNLIAVAALAFTIQFAHAQTEKGNQTLGLNLGYTYSKATEIPVDPASNGGISIQSSKTTTFNIGPSYSYFIANNLDLGVSLFYNNSTQATSQISPRATLSNTNYGGSVFLRKYVLYNNKIGFRTGGSVGYSYNRNKTDYQGNFSTNNTNYKGNVFTGGYCLIWFITPPPSWALQLILLMPLIVMGALIMACLPAALQTILILTLLTTAWCYLYFILLAGSK
jgi:hypothetical protein